MMLDVVFQVVKPLSGDMGGLFTVIVAFPEYLLIKFKVSNNRNVI